MRKSCGQAFASPPVGTSERWNAVPGPHGWSFRLGTAQGHSSMRAGGSWNLGSGLWCCTSWFRKWVGGGVLSNLH